MATVDPTQDTPPSGDTPWWLGPPPQGWTGAWPPPLEEGDTYGTAIGQVNYTPEHAAARYAAMHPTTPTNNPAPPGPPGPDNFPPYNNPYNPPSNINQGGQAGLDYIPPVPKFDAPGFQKPSGADVLNEPGYQFRLGQGQQSLEQSAAARGVLNTGGTLKDLIGYGQNFASQEYGNVYDRSERAYNLAYRGAQDEFSPLMHQYDTLAAAGQHQNDLNYQHSWDKWIQDYNIFRNNQNDRFDRLYRTSTA